MAISDLFKKDSSELLSGLPLQELLQDYNNDIVISESNVLRIPIFKKCLDMISNDVASLEVKLYKKNNGKIEEITNHRILNILNNKVNPFETAFNFKKNITKDILLYGRAYGEIQGSNLYYNKVYNYNFLKEYDINGNIEGLNIQLAKENGVYNLDIEKLLPFNYDSTDITRGTGILNSDLILKLGLHELQYSKNYISNGGFISKILLSKTPFRKEIKDKLKEDLKNLFGGSKNAGKMMVLEGDIDVKSLNNINSKDMELIDSRKYTSDEICILFGINPLYLKGEKSKDLKQQYLQVLNPIITVLEKSFEELLTDKEINQGYFIELDTKDLLKSSDKELGELATNLYNNGISSRNEARKIIGLESNETDNIKLSLGNVLQTDNGEILNFNMDSRQII